MRWDGDWDGVHFPQITVLPWEMREPTTTVLFILYFAEIFFFSSFLFVLFVLFLPPTSIPSQWMRWLEETKKRMSEAKVMYRRYFMQEQRKRPSRAMELSWMYLSSKSQAFHWVSNWSRHRCVIDQGKGREGKIYVVWQLQPSTARLPIYISHSSPSEQRHIIHFMKVKIK